jgi:hypothetical protein
VNATQVRIILVQDLQFTLGTVTSVFFDDASLEDNALPGVNLIGSGSSFETSFVDVFVTKLTADGLNLVFSTYLGGVDREIPQNVELDALGNIIVGGRTSSPDFPTANAADATYAGPIEDGFLAKLGRISGSLIFSTFVGDVDAFHPNEEIRGIVVDAANNIYVIGNTGAPNFSITDIITAPCVAAAQPRSADVFIREYSPTGVLLFSTCFGGSSRDAGRNLGFDSSGNLFATGWTESNDFPTTPGVVQPLFVGETGNFFGIDGWVSKLDINASPPIILASTYLGGDGPEFLEGLGVDSFDNVVVSGGTSATDYPTTPGAYQTTYGGDNLTGAVGDGVVTKLAPDLTSFGFSTFLGGTGDDFAWGLKMDIEDRPYVTGPTSSPDFPVFDPLQPGLSGPQDVFVTQLSADGSLLEFSTYLGGSGFENASNGITVLNPGNVFVTGNTDSANFPLETPFQGAIAGSSDAFITNISTPVTVPATDCTTTAGGCNPTGGQEILLPEGFVVPANATITQTAVPQVDTRFDPLTGRCNGMPLELFGGDLVIPGHLCGGADGFTVLVTETTNINILEGTVLSIGFPEVFSPDALECERPIVTDRQLQDVMVWQTTNKSDLIEGRAIEVTHDCGTSRSRTRRLSFFVIGMFIDLVPPGSTPDAVTQAFVNLLIQKTDALITATAAAEPVLKNGDLVKLRTKARDIRAKLVEGDYLEALNKTNIFLAFIDKAIFDTTVPFNHEGELIMRAGNIKFILEVKVLPFVP